MRNFAPEWAMVGWPTDDGRYSLLASKNLASATLDWVAQAYHFESWEAFMRPGAFRPSWHVDIVGAGGREAFIIVTADSYAECLADLLFKHGWRADREPLELRDPIEDRLTQIKGHRASYVIVDDPRAEILEGEVVDG